jgi:hypothetical protein
VEAEFEFRSNEVGRRRSRIETEYPFVLGLLMLSQSIQPN